MLVPTRSPSNLTPGSDAGLLPVAMRMCLERRFLVRAVRRFDQHSPGAGNPAVAEVARDFVLLEKAVDALA